MLEDAGKAVGIAPTAKDTLGREAEQSAEACKIDVTDILHLRPGYYIFQVPFLALITRFAVSVIACVPAAFLWNPEDSRSLSSLTEGTYIYITGGSLALTRNQNT